MGADSKQLEQLLRAMFDHDAQGRLTGVAPLLHVLRTRDEVFVRTHARVRDDNARSLEAMARAPRGRAEAWAQDYARYIELVGGHEPVGAVRAGPLYRFQVDLPDGSDCLRITAENHHLLRDGLDEWEPDAQAGALMVAAMVEGRAASVCATVRAFGGVQCAGVETSPAFRGRGLAAQTVATWAGLVRADGGEPFYATTFDNLASQAIAKRLGLELIGSEFSIYGA